MGTGAPLESRRPTGGGLTGARARAAIASARGERTRAATVIDVLLVVGCALAAVWTIVGQRSVWAMLPSWWVPLDVAIGVLASVVLWWRRRHPVAVAAATGLLGGVFIAAGAPAVIAVYTLASLRPAWIALLVAGLHLTIAIPYYLVVPVGGIGIATWAAAMVLIYATTLALGLAVRARRQVIIALVAAADAELRDQQLRTAHVREAERARIAREMHDVLAHRLSILSVHAGALEHRTREGGANPLDANQVRQAAVVIRSSAHAALEELREVLAVLGSGHADGELGAGAPQPTIVDLPRLVADADGAGQRVRLQLDDPHRLSACRPQLQRTVYRVVQEGLTNARKHAAGALSEVAITSDTEHGVRVTVSNSVPVGVTQTEIPGAGTGLAGLVERVELDGGSLRTVVDDGRYTLEVTLPWRT